MKSFDEIKELIAKTQGDVDKADNGDKAACVRVRAALQKVKDLVLEARKEALDLKNA